MPELDQASNAYFDAAFDGQKYMAIFRGLPLDDTLAACRAAWDAGIDMVEVPIQTPEALQALRAAVRAGQERGRQVGAGTVISPELVRAAREAGAAFTVAPGLDADVVRAARDENMPHLPGVATATEIGAALRHGLRWLKAFPAAQLGSGWVKAQVSGPFPDVSFVVTGGMSPANAAEFLAAGARVVALGSAVTDPAQLASLP
jgi:Entner-Doudoroff aldolase